MEDANEFAHVHGFILAPDRAARSLLLLVKLKGYGFSLTHPVLCKCYVLLGMLSTAVSGL